MMLTRRALGLTALGLAVSATLAACSSKSQDEATEEGKMALIVSDAGDAAAEALSKAVEAFTKETKVEVEVKPVSDVSQELARGITAEPTIDVVVLNPAQLSSYAGSLHSWDKGAAAVKDAHPALLTSADGTKATASSEGSVAGLSQVKKLLSSGSAGWGADLPAGSAADAFGQGQAAMVIETEALTKTLADAYSGISYKVVELPAGSGGKGTLQFPTFYGVVEASKHKADAIKLVEYLTAAERQVALAGAAGTVPAGKAAGETWKGKHADQAAFLAGVEYSQPVPSASGTSDIIANFDNELPGLAGGDPASILGSAQVNLQAVLS